MSTPRQSAQTLNSSFRFKRPAAAVAVAAASAVPNAAGWTHPDPPSQEGSCRSGDGSEEKGEDSHDLLDGLDEESLFGDF